ncbi:MAG: prepilin-type N-terminal cleavage/methylation domain-containing protein [Desulfobacterales bacterium]
MSHSDKTRNFARPDTAGFSLIELMIALAIASIVSAAIYSVYTGLMRSYTTQNVAADIQQNVRAGIDYMAEDIMMAGLNPSKAIGFGFVEASATKLRFTLDRNLNGSVDETDSEQITFEYDSGTGNLNHILFEGTGSENQVVFFDNVQNLTFTYLDESGAVTATLADIRMVDIDFTIQAPAGRQGMVNRTYTTRVKCRNIGL